MGRKYKLNEKKNRLENLLRFKDGVSYKIQNGGRYNDKIK